MLPSRGNHSKEYGKPPEEKEHLILDFSVEGQIGNAAEGHVATQELTSAVGSVDPSGKKNPPVPLFGDLGDKVNNMLQRLGASINKALHIKQQRLETKFESLKGSDKKIKQIWEEEQSQIEKLNEEFSGKFAVLFQQWKVLMQDFEGKQEKLNQARIDRQIQNTRKDEQFAEFLKMFERYEDVRITENNATKYSAFQELESRAERDREVTQQNNTVEQSRIMQMKRVQTIICTHEKYLKDLAAMEKNHDDLLTGVQNKLKKDMNKLNRKLLRETQCQELETVHQALQNMFSKMRRSFEERA